MNERTGELVRPNVEELRGDMAAVVARINELGDTGRLVGYEKRLNSRGQAYFVVQTRPLEARVMQHGRPTRRVHPALVWTGVAGGMGALGVLAWAVVVLVEAIAANIVLLAGLALLGAVALGLVGRKCVITITHRH